MTNEEKLQLLGIQEVTTNRQKKNGTRIFKLPIKKYGQFIEVGSFKSGYIRRMNGGYTPYQLNKCEPNIEYHKDYDHFQDQNGNWRCEPNGKYNKYVGKRRITIDNEYDRINYLITYCLKNYYINQANMIENGNFIPKWKHEYEMKNGSIDKVRELQNENNRLHNIYLKQTTEITELKKEIDKINDYNYDKIEGLEQEIRDKGALDNLSVIVNNERYKII